MATVSPEASTATPDPSDQREPSALYRLYAVDGTLLYIGVTDNPQRRFNQHSCSKPWWPQVVKKTIEWHFNRRRALAAEAAAIEAETPVHNIEHNPAAPEPVSPHHPPAGMAQDRVDALRQVAATLPEDLGNGILRSGFEGFIRAQSTPASEDQRDHSAATLTKNVTVTIGRCTGAPSNGEPTEHWATPDMDAYSFEAIYDPTQISLADAESRVRAQLAEQFIRVERFLNEDADPAACQVWPGLCTETQRGHYDHSNHEHAVTGKSGTPLLDTGFVQLSDGNGPAVYIAGMGNEDYAPEEVRAATAKIRRLLDKADAMADQVLATQRALEHAERAEVQA